ncbi:major capsid protein [Dipodfec virus RodF1_35]|uniref:Major capsid protein n=1 Tax=Dipodfec virus RodF1_35 TaxID=2929295 RepID=A0A976R8Y1_9VIRU|nr:major capsid protein [Dipodfec virus RodF1_35]
MAKNPYSAFKAANEKIGRSNFSLSHNVNTSMGFGTAIPLPPIEVLPGDSFEMSLASGLRTLPFLFPVQTPIRARVMAFYGRNRVLYKDWPDFIFNNDSSLVSPVFAGTSEQLSRTFAPRGLADYLGWPVMVYGNYDFSSISTKVTYAAWTDSTGGGHNSIHGFFVVPGFLHGDATTVDNVSADVVSVPFNFPYTKANVGKSVYVGNPFFWKPSSNILVGSESDFYVSFNPSDTHPASDWTLHGLAIFQQATDDEGNPYGDPNDLHNYVHLRSYHPQITPSYPLPRFSKNELTGRWTADLKLTMLDSLSPNGNYVVVPFIQTSNMAPISAEMNFEYASLDYYSINFVTRLLDDKAANTTSQGKALAQKTSVLPFRLYESIYNSFIRDPSNNPYYVNGRLEYNKFIPTDAGGSDSTVYDLHRVNWEYDRFTSSYPTPQQGLAPLVGLTSSGTAVFVDSDSVAHELVPVIGDDGSTIENFEDLDKVPDSVRRSAVRAVTNGISINDFRNVNALQRWLETNIRKGYRYSNQLEGHFDVKPHFNVLDMPEFLGGATFDLNTQVVTATADSSSNPLGTQVGVGSAFGKSKTFRCNCDEHGFIMFIIYVTPVPVYAQSLPKYFIKDNPLDYYSPEFANLGMQPVSTLELAPLQGSAGSITNPSVFGYNRAWYDYLSCLDVSTGQFRTSYRDMVLSRVFGGVPKLSPSFIEVRPEGLNEIFARHNSDDPIFGQIHLEISAKRKIPLVALPRLE